MGGNVSSAPSAPAAKGSASPVRSPNAPGFGSSLGSMSNALRGSVAQVQQPMQGGYGGMMGGGGAPGPNMGGGKSSGAGQGGYGGAPGFGGQQFTAQNNPTSTPFSPYGPADPSVYTTSYPNMPSPPSGGKSLGGVAPYGSAPGFGGQPAMQQDFVNPRGTMSPEMQAYYAQDRANQAERFNRFSQPMQQFNPYQQSPFNPYQQPMQPQFDQQQSGLMALSNLLGGIFGRGRRG